MAKDVVEEMYVNKQFDYFSLEREIFKNAITEKGLNILDIGCGTGVLGSFFRKNQDCRVVGIEINQDAFLVAKENLDEALHANVEIIELPFEAGSFDAIVMGDVLEHLVNPVPALKKLMNVLKPGGKIYITVPNIRHWKILLNLVFRDRWDYMTWGILDYTHLRFFTKTSILKLLAENEIRVVKSQRVIQKPSKSHFIDVCTFRLFSGLLASHTFLIIEK